MTEEERLGKIAYEAYQDSKYGSHPAHKTAWSELPDFWQRDWIAAARAVVEDVLREQQIAVEASE